ncbi:hypothetical protein [Nocardia sp. X0981]
MRARFGWVAELMRGTSSARTSSPAATQHREPGRRGRKIGVVVVGARKVLTGIRARFPLLGLVWVDGGYVGTVDISSVGWAAATQGRGGAS